MNEIASTQKDIKKVFDILEISKVVYVDDDFNFEFEKILLPGNRDLILHDYFPMITVTDEEIQNKQIRDQWVKLDHKTKVEINQKILGKDYNATEIDNKAISAFFEILPQEMLYPISPYQWIEEKEKLLQNGKNILFLFDQDLKTAEGRNEDGIKIIKEISQNREIISALFTQTVSKDGCMQSRDKLSKKYKIQKERFFVVPKEILPNDTLYFIFLLKMTILTGNFVKFKKEANAILTGVLKKAKKKIDEIGIEDFDHIMFKAPGKEGQWEPDMFFRLYSHFQRKDFYTTAYANTKLQEMISKIRLVSNIPDTSASFIIPSKAWEIQHSELYEDGDYLNKSHLPIELGDIFEKTDSTSSKKYILLVQPCDLMLRGNGFRARKENRFALLEMKISNERQYKTMFEEEVVYFGDTPEQKWFVKFKDVHFIKDYILDLCVYNDDGIARFDSDVNEKENIRPSLTNRYILIKEKIEKESKYGEELIKNIEPKDATINTKIMEIFFHDDLFQGKYAKIDKGYTIIYNCKRIGRLNRSRATGLLMSYTSTIQRPAYEMDFGRFEESLL
ncbi:MAG: hypothetical protein LBE13_17335 [Bacteroidales bacterium]|jgi:hypothetical protein|nr:hypothetical protein [Bacteroidales bacterium]